MAKIYGLTGQWDGYVESTRFTRSFCFSFSVPDDAWGRYLEAEQAFETALTELSELEKEAKNRERDRE